MAAARVVHISSAHPPGDTRIFLKQCRTLASAGYDVHLIVQNPRDEVRDGISLWGIRAPRSDRRLERMTRTVLEVYRRARDLEADLYHLHDPELIPIGLLLR